MPTETTYSYSIENDLPSGGVNIQRLEDEIASSSIVTALQGITASSSQIPTSGVYVQGTLNITFKDVLSTADKTTLDNDTTAPSGGLLALHDNSATAEAPALVKIEQTDTDKLGRYRALTIPLSVPAGQNLTIQHSWPHPIYIFSVHFTSDSTHVGDAITTTVAKDMALGTLTADVSIGANALTSSNTTGLYVGDYLVLDDTSNQNDLGLVTSINRTTGEIGFETATTHAFLTGDTVRMHATTIGRQFHIGAPGFHPIGDDKVTSTRIPANVPVTIEYHNLNSQTLVPKYLVLEIGTQNESN